MTPPADSLPGVAVKPVELVLEPLELPGQLRSAEKLHGRELTEPLAQAHLVLAGHQFLWKKRSSRERVGRSSERGTIASRWPKR